MDECTAPDFEEALAAILAEMEKRWLDKSYDALMPDWLIKEAITAAWNARGAADKESIYGIVKDVNLLRQCRAALSDFDI